MSRYTAIVALVLFSTPVFAGEQATFSVDVDVVNLFAIVRDSKGNLVSGLGRDHFILDDNGHRQRVQYFSSRTNAPLLIGLLVDTSFSQRQLLDDERRTASLFLDTVLRPEVDRAFLVRFDFDTELIQDLTDSRKRLREALAGLQVSERLQLMDPLRLPRGPVGTAMYDAVYLASHDVLRQRQVRKVIILITDGVDMGSLVSRDQAIEMAQRADTTLYGIRYFDSRSDSSRNEKLPGVTKRPGVMNLQRLCRETGGKFFKVDGELTLARIFDRIQTELGNQYSLGYTPERVPESGFHTIRLRVKDRKLDVRTRTGYYPKSKRQSKPPAQ